MFKAWQCWSWSSRAQTSRPQDVRCSQGSCTHLDGKSRRLGLPKVHGKLTQLTYTLNVGSSGPPCPLEIWRPFIQSPNYDLLNLQASFSLRTPTRHPKVISVRLLQDLLPRALLSSSVLLYPGCWLDASSGFHSEAQEEGRLRRHIFVSLTIESAECGQGLRLLLPRFELFPSLLHLTRLFFHTYTHQTHQHAPLSSLRSLDAQLVSHMGLALEFLFKT